MKSINWGFLGSSVISLTMADAIKAEGSSTIHSIAGRSAARLKVFAERYNIEHTFEDYNELIEDEAVDIIYIALPNHLHHEYVIKAAQAGKAILCEKSLSVDMEKTAAAIAAVRAYNVFFVEGLMYRHHPLTSEILSVIRSGQLGEIRSIHAQYCAPIAQFVNPNSKGSVYNLGCYPMSLTHLALQAAHTEWSFESLSLSAKGRRGEDGNICETAATLQLNNGIICQLHTSENYGLHYNFSVLGSKASLTLGSNPWLPKAKGNHLLVAPYEKRPEPIEIQAEGDAFFYQVRAIVKALREGKTSVPFPAPSLEDSYQIMQLLTEWERVTEVRPVQTPL